MTAGEGGMVSVSDPGTERMMRLYRNQGMLRQYENEIVGFNNRMSDIHAAIGRVQLGKIAAWTKQRQENAHFLSTHLEGVGTPQVAADSVHVFHQYTVRVTEDRDRFAQALREEYGVGTGLFYKTPIHRLAPFETDDVAVVQLPPATAIDLAVHRHVAVDDRLFDVPARIEDSRELEELPEPEHLRPDGYVDGAGRGGHPGMLAESAVFDGR